jgi:excisionase family DNA binding protein
VEEEDEVLTVSEVAARLKLSENAIRRMCDKGTFVGVFRAGDRQWRIPATSVDEYIARQQQAEQDRRG